MLFSSYSVLDVLPHQKRQIADEIRNLEADYVLNASEEDLVRWLVGKFTFNTPILDKGNIHVEHKETQIDVSHDPMRMFIDRSQPFYVAGTELTFAIPFEGEANLFEVKPQNFTWSSSGSNAEVVGQEIHITYTGTNLNPQGARSRFDAELSLLEQNLANLRAFIDQYNSELEGLIRTQIQDRKAKLLSDAHCAASIGFPVRRKEGAPTTYAVPVHRHKAVIERPPISPGPFEPEPTLAMSEYEHILDIVRNMVQVMERSPRAFETMGEEDLRTHFLVQLNGQYEGRATGETFNFLGKTDILIRADGRNVFIAECKFWNGEKQFLDTVDQLLSYVSWRDTKAAVLVFSRNANFSEVLTKIADAAPKHKNYKRTIGTTDESTFRYVLHQPNDANREVILSVLAFDIPQKHSRPAAAG